MNTVRVHLLLAVTAALGCCVKSRYNDIIQTTLGQLMGLRETIEVRNTETVDVDIFWGIPYARPPVGGLRFKAPLPANRWNGLFYAIRRPNSCFQVRGNNSILVDSQPPSRLSEDCLYLNIWRPRCHSAGQNMAVMLWIHGGSFMTGSTADPVYNGAILAATECVIVVSVNYRLGPFGFMFIGNEESPGNMGLLDVIMALKWVKDNVANFGGDPERITLFGQGTGGTMVSFLLMSHLSRDLFNNAIIQSGNPLIRFSYQGREFRNYAAYTLSRTLNCGSFGTPARTLVQCLRQVSAQRLAQTHAALATADLNYYMVPVADGNFLSRSPTQMIRQGDVKRCSIMIGATNDEGTFILNKVKPTDFNFGIQNLPVLTELAVFSDVVDLLAMVFRTDYLIEIMTSAKQLYNYNYLMSAYPAHPGLLLIKFIIRDLIFLCPAYFIANTYVDTLQNVYMYRYDYIRNNTILPAWVGATHGSEVPLEFRTITRAYPRISYSDAQMSENIMKRWANFARFGNPTPPDDTITPTWLMYTHDDLYIMVFGEEDILGNEPVDSRYCDYWNGIPNYYYHGI